MWPPGCTGKGRSKRSSQKPSSVRTQTHIHTYTCTHICKHLHIHAHVHTHAYIYTCTHKHMQQMRTHVHMHTHNHTYIHIYSCVHTHTHVQIPHACTHRHTHKRVHMSAHTHTPIHLPPLPLQGLNTTVIEVPSQSSLPWSLPCDLCSIGPPQTPGGPQHHHMLPLRTPQDFSVSARLMLVGSLFVPGRSCVWLSSIPGVYPLDGSTHTHPPQGLLGHSHPSWASLVYTISCFLVLPLSIWDLSSLMRDQTHDPCIGSTESKLLDCRGSSYTISLIKPSAPGEQVPCYFLFYFLPATWLCIQQIAWQYLLEWRHD